MAIKFQLEPDEALVFYHLLTQIDDEGELTYGPPERKLTRGIIKILEERLEFPPDTDYDELVNEARARVDQALPEE
ncbi:MAG: hypothetical protein D6820_15435 [Lentisphaerae bacterium]|nr:MAG: hypothetical protein D6820_15435 [Lentisphaerota bacterium]